MPYHVGSKGSYGCEGYPAVKDDGTVMGCHKSKGAAARQIYAINVSEGKIGKAMVKEGDMVMAPNDDEVYVGRVVHVMTDGMLGMPGSEYALAASPEEPAILIQLFEMEEGGLEETEYFIGKKASEVMAMPSLEANEGMDKSMDNGSYDMEDEEDDEEDDMSKEYQGCGCPTCKELNVNCDQCPVCLAGGMKNTCCANMNKGRLANAPYQDANSEMEMEEEDDAIEEARRRMINEELGKAKKPNYEDMIKPRRGGSTPSNPRLYARIVQEAKDRFDVYPSAVANGWVVQEYKRRGGTYKMYDEDMDKREFSGATRERMAEAGTAMPDGSFPIGNRADLMNAIRSVGRAKNYAAAKQHIVRRARALNAMDMLPEDWRNKATKGMGEWSGSIFDLNPFVK
jgi:hypothetical protein